jgi:hypothetical protein
MNSIATLSATRLRSLTLVGDKNWEKRMARVRMPFTGSKMSCVDASELDTARAWVLQDWMPSKASHQIQGT